MSRSIGETPPSVRSDVGAGGRLRPRTDAERRAQSAALRAALDEVEAISPDASDAPEAWADAFRGIDAARPHRPLFSGMG